MTAERTARLFVLALVLGVPLTALIARWTGDDGFPGPTIELHGRMAQDGGWTPRDLTADVGQPLHLRLVSDDVMHGFAIGQIDLPAVDMKPGEVTEATVTFDRPGKYVFYCTRWCGVNHWRMRGTIEVSGTAAEPDVETFPLYLSLGLDLDAPHPADIVPDRTPAAGRSAGLGVAIADRYLSQDHYRSHSPVETWRSLRAELVALQLSEMEVWDLVALVWKLNTTPAALEVGGRIYAANCAACHGEAGGGDGVMALALASDSLAELGHGTTSPADFTDKERMLGASPALLQGKIIRGGMGTGMPYWGPIFTESETWAIVDYLRSFQFQIGERP